jgi:hypothetical protein
MFFSGCDFGQHIGVNLFAQLKRNFHRSAGLPDGIFSKQKYQFGKILEGLAKEGVGNFKDNLVYFVDI